MCAFVHVFVHVHPLQKIFVESSIYLLVETIETEVTIHNVILTKLYKYYNKDLLLLSITILYKQK